MPSSLLAQIAETVRFDAEGHVRSHDEKTPIRIQQRAGDWQVLDSSPDLMLLLRSTTAEQPLPDRRVILSGDLGAIPTADLVMFLNQGRFTGILLIRAEGVDRTLSFKDGRICWGSSTDSSERLGAVAVRNGLVTREALARVAESGDFDEPGKRLGQKLVQMGLLNGHQQWRALQLHVSEIFFSFLIKKSGSFVFITAPSDPSLESHLAIDPQGLLLEGVRRVDELRHFRKKIPSALVKPRLTGAPLPPHANETDRRVASLIDGKRSVIDLGMASSLGEFGATKSLYHLMELGVAAIDLVALRERTPGPRNNSPASVVASFNEALVGIYEAAASSGMDAPYRISLDAFLLSEKGSSPLLTGLCLEPDGTLPEETILARVQPETGAAVRDQLEQVLSFALFQANEILDSGSAEELAKRARALTAA